LAEHGLRRERLAVLIRARRTEKLAALALLFMLLIAAMAGVTSVLRGPDWTSLWKSLFVGLLVGWGLAIFRQPARRAAWMAVLLGLAYMLLIPGGLLGKVAAASVELLRLAIHLIIFPVGLGPDWASLLGYLQEMSTSTSVVIGRVGVWVAALISNQPAFDPVAATLVWSILVWVVAAWAGWAVEARQSALLAALPAVLLSLATLSYGGRMTPVLYLMLAATLLLLAIVQYGKRQQEWDETGVAYPKAKARQVGSAAALVTAMLVLLALLAASISIQRITEWVSEYRNPSVGQKDALGESLGIVPGGTSEPDAFATVRRPGLPQAHLIGSGPELSRRVVMTVSIPGLPSLSQAGGSLPLYWRSFTYDVYTGHGWGTSQTEPRTYRANQPLQAEQAPDHISLRQQVRPVEDLGGVVYADGELAAVDLRSQAAWRSSGDLFGVQLEVTAPYQAMSLVPVASERTLRAAGQHYPDWVRQRYLTLPAEVPDRVKELAIELTASEPTPYDRARAIEAYLRTFPYTLDVPRPPTNQDVVGYFLFDLRKGYCDYYASAMVVLARAAGIPARLVTGYASGTYNLNSKRFIVTEADAHSWVEVYFPEVGWVPFEPTAGHPPLQRTAQTVPERPLAPPLPAQTSGTNQPFPLLWGWLALLGLVVILGIVSGGWALFDELRLGRLSERAAAVEVYRRIRRYGSYLEVASQAGDTPYEFLALLAARLREVTNQQGGSVFGQRAAGALGSIADRIVQVSYHPSPLRAARRSSVLEQWRRLRWQLRLARVLKNWGSIRQRFMAK
jgi:hypothetical protein